MEIVCIRPKLHYSTDLGKMLYCVMYIYLQSINFILNVSRRSEYIVTCISDYRRGLD
jgi:hypothetical protein